MGNLIRIIFVSIGSIAFVTTGTFAAAPNCPISAQYGTVGQAPFVLHVNANGSCTMGAGDKTTGRFEWTFGDSGGLYNKLESFGAAHLYENPGSYLVTLKVTNSNRESSTYTMTVSVGQSTRRLIHVSAAGNDSNDGQTHATAVRTIVRANAIVNQYAGEEIMLLRSGDTFETTTQPLAQIVRAYGSGNKPILKWMGTGTYSAVFNDFANGRMVRDIQIDSNNSPQANIINGFYVSGSGSIINTRIRNVAYAVKAEPGASGILMMNNTIDLIGEYTFWGESNTKEITILGNSSQGSLNGQCLIRTYGDNINILKNQLKNTNASVALAKHRGKNAYIAGNLLEKPAGGENDDGRIRVGYFYSCGSGLCYSSFDDAVIEGNTFKNTKIIVHAGAERLNIRNNIFDMNGITPMFIDVWASGFNAYSKKVRVLNNTGKNSSSSGSFVQFKGGNPQSGNEFIVANNLYVAPYLNPGSNNTANVMVLNAASGASGLSGFSIFRNVWQDSSTQPNKEFSVTTGDVEGGYMPLTTWLSNYTQTVEDITAYVSLYADYSPYTNSAADNYSNPVAGVFADFNGFSRPTGMWTAGAIELHPASASLPGDANGDGGVNVDDLLLVIAAWGTSNPSGDVTHNGIVNVDDLLLVVTNWSAT